MIRTKVKSTGARAAMVAAIALFALPAAASGLKDFAGEWSCNLETKFTLSNEIQYVAIYALDAERNGNVSGHTIQVHPGDFFFPPFELRCDFEGTAEVQQPGFYKFSVTGGCNGEEATGEVSVAECVGALHVPGVGFRKMYCIETSQQATAPIEAAGECERRDAP